jgi:SAM-dependent methyltransferase
MTLFYRIAYAIGFTPWELAATHPAAADHITALFDREERERTPPYGSALDIGCGSGHWAIELARRGWQVTGIDIVARAIRQAREGAQRAGVDGRFIEGDVTALGAAGVGSGFSFVWDFGTVHGLTPDERAVVGREVSAATAPDATMLMLAWAPGRRGPLPRGASRADIEAAFPDWTVIGEDLFDTTGLPILLRKSDPRCYRLRRK